MTNVEFPNDEVRGWRIALHSAGALATESWSLKSGPAEWHSLPKKTPGLSRSRVWEKFFGCACQGSIPATAAAAAFVAATAATFVAAATAAAFVAAATTAATITAAAAAVACATSARS